MSKFFTSISLALLLATGAYAQADETICQQTDETVLVDADEFITAQCGGGTNEKISAVEIKAYILSANSVDGTMIALGSDAQGDIMYYNGTDYVRLAPGTSGQVLQTQGAGANPQWAAGGGGGDMTKAVYDTDDDTFVDLTEGTALHAVRKGSAGTITAGQLVYISGYNASGWTEVELADADGSGTMPSVCMAIGNITNAATTYCVAEGLVINLNTTGMTANDALYVSATAGAFTDTRPTGEAAEVQAIGRVLRAHLSQGIVQIFGAGRSNDIPNLDDGAIFVGSASNVGAAVDVTGDVSLSNAGVTTVSDLTITSEAQGDILYFNGSNWVRLAPGTDGHYLETNGAGANPSWSAPAGGGGGSTPAREFYFPAGSLRGGMNAANVGAASYHDEGTNFDVDVLAYDDSTDECAGGQFQVPSDITTTGTDNVTFRLRYYAATGATDSAYWDFKHVARDAGEVWDAAWTTESDGGCAPGSATQDTIAECTWTETVTNTGWAALDVVFFEVCRDANHASDNLTGDARLIDFAVEVIRE